MCRCLLLRRRYGAQFGPARQRTFGLDIEDARLSLRSEDERIRLSRGPRLQGGNLLQRAVETGMVRERHVHAACFGDGGEFLHRIGIGGVTRFTRLATEANAAP